MRTIHGGDWAGYRQEYGTDALDFSANTSPLGLPAGVRAAVIESLDSADRYTDPKCRALRDALAERHHVSAEWIRCGNGAADLIDRAIFALRPKKALILAPTFGEYYDKPTQGDPLRPIEPEDIKRANRMNYFAGTLGLLLFCGLRTAAVLWMGGK